MRPASPCVSVQRADHGPTGSNAPRRGPARLSDLAPGGRTSPGRPTQFAKGGGCAVVGAPVETDAMTKLFNALLLAHGDGSPGR